MCKSISVPLVTLNDGDGIIDENETSSSYDVPKTSTIVSKEIEPQNENIQRKPGKKPSKSFVFSNIMAQVFTRLHLRGTAFLVLIHFAMFKLIFALI